MQEMQVQSLGWEHPWRRKWQPTPVFLPGKSHGQRSLGAQSMGSQRVRQDLATEHTPIRGPELRVNSLNSVLNFSG